MKQGNDRGIAPFSQDAVGLAGKPFVAMAKQVHQLLAGKLAEMQPGGRLCSLVLHFINPAVAPVPVIDGIDVVNTLVAPIGDVESPLGSDQEIDRPKPGIVAQEKVAAEMGGEA